MARRLSRKQLRIASKIDVGSIVTQKIHNGSCDVGIVVAITERVGAKHLLNIDGSITDDGIVCPYGIFMCFWKFRPQLEPRPMCNITGDWISSVTFSSKTVSR